MHESNAREWYALIAGATGTMEPAGRVLAELVSREECSDGARFAQVLVINQLGRATPFDFVGQLRHLAGEKWHPGNLNYFFLRAAASNTYKQRFQLIANGLGADKQAPLAPVICFEHAVERAWESWCDKIAQRMPVMPEELHGQFQEAVQLPLRRSLTARIHEVMQQMPGYLEELGLTDYGVEHQLTYPRMVEGFTLTAGKFLRHVEERAEALLKSDAEHVAELAARIQELREERVEVTDETATEDAVQTLLVENQ